MAGVVRPDICVIGAGSGGLSVAAGAAAFGVSVVLVERGRMGGDCLNYGCVPSKALIAAARRVHLLRRAGPYLGTAQPPQLDFPKIRQEIRAAIAAIAPNDSVERFTALGVTVLRADARFVDRRTLVAGGQTIRARRFVIATGSAPAAPDIPGLESVDYLTNESLFDLEQLPESLLVLGGGPVGIEMAQAFCRLGSRVTVLENREILGRADPDLRRIVVDRLRAEGVTLLEGVRVEAVENRAGGVTAHLLASDGRQTAVAGVRLLVAAGRRPVVDGLGLESAGVRHGPGGIVVNGGQRSSNRRIYAVGDVAGGPQFTHVAGHQASLVLKGILFRAWARFRPEIVPAVTYCDPEIAFVGLSEAEARRRHRRVQIVRWPFAENDRAQIEGETTGFVKLVAGAR
ncbi:FAD-dependent oxidoreductase, partial [Rhizobium sp. TRM95111]|uniref:dihydrolipoyl dehydrogenase family protein n=1 Tax=Rhizobium alarense TaxID=2846851 RepID=UPI001F2C0116